MSETIIYFRSGAHERPIIKVVDNEKDQVVLHFLEAKQEHLTLHLQQRGIVLRTHWSSEKPKGGWDDTRVEIAKKLGFTNPEKHGKYYVHSPVGSISDSLPLHLIGKQVDINKAPNDKLKYKKLRKVTIEVPAEVIMVSFYLYPTGLPSGSLEFIETSLGTIIMDF
jgi:hypothetical protein